jgi:hypothetical protein
MPKCFKKYTIVRGIFKCMEIPVKKQMIFVKPYLLLLNLLLKDASSLLDNSLSNLLMRKRSSNYMRVSGTHHRPITNCLIVCGTHFRKELH